MEPSHQADAPEEHVKIEVDREHVFLLRKENEKQKLEDKIVRRSKLLTDLLDSKPGQATLPVDAGSLDGWRKYVQIYLTKERSEELSNIANEDMVMLVKVSEFLLDTETAQRTAKALADEVLVNAEIGSIANKVLAELHPDLQLKVVKASGCSLAHLQSRLVSELQPLALEAFVKEGDKLDLSEELVFRGTPENPVGGLPLGLSDMTHLKFLSLANSDAAAGDPQAMSEALSKLISLTHLDLRCNMLQTAACGPLAAALVCISHLAHLDLSCNVLQRQGLEALCPAISELQKVTFLSLAENSIVAGTSALKMILCSLPELSQLALDHNAILRPADSTPEASIGATEQSADRPRAEYTPVTALASLKLSNNCLDNSDIDLHVRPLIDACVNITALDLSDNSLSTKAVPAMCKLAGTCTTLRSLDVSSCAFSCDEIAEILSAIPDQPQATEESDGAKGQESVGPAPVLESLALREMDPFPLEPEEEVDALPTALQRLVNLKSFDISALELPAHAMEALPIGRLTALTMLDVSMNSVLQQSPLGTQLSSLKVLQSLNISSLFLPDDVLLALAAALSKLTALSLLDMGNNAITAGPACSALSKALAALPSLHTLDMSDNDILDANSEFVAVLPRMSSLKKLGLEQNELHEDTIAPLACALSQLTLLEDVAMAAICAVGPRGDVPPALRLCSTLTSLTNLTSLNISNNDFQGPRDSSLAEILTPLCKLCNLEMSCVELPHAQIGCTANILAKMSSLTSLDLSSNRLRLEGAKALAEHLSKMTWLRDLDLSSCMLTPEGLRVIGDSMQPLTALRAIRLDDVVGSGSLPESWSKVFASLSGIRGLRELELRYNRFPSSCIAEHISPHMSGLTALESLDFQDCGMSREGVKQMLLAMEPLTSIHSLNLGGNRIKDNVSNIVRNHPLLEELDLPHAHLKDEEACELLKSIKPLKMLRLVTLTDNYISEAVLNTVGEELPHVLVVFDDVAEIDEVISIDEDDEDDDGLGDDEDEDEEEGENDEDDDSDNETGTGFGSYSGSYSDSGTEEYISDEEAT